jgi:putative GTP pyrophosphokinase
MAKKKPMPPIRTFNAIVDAYREQNSDYQQLQELLEASLKQLKRACGAVHSYGARMKEPTHLRDKLERRWWDRQAERKDFDVTPANFHRKINDLVGGRVLHLHSKQFPEIHRAIEDVFVAKGYRVLNNGPEAKVWDPEYAQLFAQLQIRCVSKDSFYTSVHYEFELHGRSPKLTCELQVRTLAEELWGATDHLINYPHKCEIESCREQILVLARATSTCTRLVDSIMGTFHASPAARATRTETGTRTRRASGSTRK